MELNVISIKELDERLIAYAAATKKRVSPLVKVFFGLIATAFVVIIFGGSVGLSKSYILIVCFALLAGLVALAIYVIATARKWHKQNGVFCAECGNSLVCLGEYMEAIENGEEELPTTMECPKCGAIVARS